jgi:hypothetical protein
MGTHGNCGAPSSGRTVVFAQHDWKRFRALEPSSKQAGTAQKAIDLCRMRIQQQQAQAGSPSVIASEALSCERPSHHLVKY